MQKPEDQGFAKILGQLREALLVPLLAIITGIILGGFIIWVAGGDPIAAYVDSSTEPLVRQ